MFCPRDRILYKSYRCMLLSSPGPTVAETPPVLHLVSVQNTELQPFEQSDPENCKPDVGKRTQLYFLSLLCKMHTSHNNPGCNSLNLYEMKTITQQTFLRVSQMIFSFFFGLSSFTPWPCSYLSAWKCPTCQWARRGPPLVDGWASCRQLYRFPSCLQAAIWRLHRAAGGGRCFLCH